MRRPRFRVTITETLKRVVEVEANDPYEAEQMVSDGWHSGKYILDAEDFMDVEFDVVPAACGSVPEENGSDEMNNSEKFKEENHAV